MRLTQSSQLFLVLFTIVLLIEITVIGIVMVAVLFTLWALNEAFK